MLQGRFKAASMRRAQDDVRGEQQDHDDVDGELAHDARQQTDRRTQTGFCRRLPFPAASQFQQGRADERADNDSRQAKEKADDAAEHRAQRPAPGRAKFVGSEPTGHEIEHQGGYREQHQDNQHGLVDTGCAKTEPVTNRCGQDDQRARESGYEAADQPRQHHQQGEAQPDDFRRCHEMKL